MNKRNLNLKGIVLGVILFLGANAAFATGNIRINSYLDTDLSIVSIINPTQATLRMNITDATGNLYYSKKVSSATTAQKLFDFSYLEDGVYKIELTGAKESIEKEFEVANNKLVNAEVKQNTAKTMFRSDANNLFVTYLSFENKDLNISITDEFGKEVFTKNYTSEPTFSKKFNVEALPEGDYKIRLISNNKEYNYAFSK